MRNQIPDFSKPTSDSTLTVDAAGNPLQVGDLLYSNMRPFRGGFEPQIEIYAPVELRDGALVIPHGGSFMVQSFIGRYTWIIPGKNHKPCPV